MSRALKLHLGTLWHSLRLFGLVSLVLCIKKRQWLEILARLYSAYEMSYNNVPEALSAVDSDLALEAEPVVVSLGALR